jgi:hypothetical protein
MRGFVPRFALEAGFLILLGVGAGYADLRPAVIVAIVAAGWILVTLVELAVWRAQAHPAVVSAPPPVLEEEVGADTAPDDRAYPLRAEAGDAPSEEVEAYTRILGAGSDEEAAAE